MNKKLLSVILVLMLLVCLTTCLISCNKEDANDTNTSEGGSSFKVRQPRTIHPDTQLIISASETMSASEVVANISFLQVGKGVIQVDAWPIGNNQFKIITHSQLMIGEEYRIRVLDSRLSIIDPYSDTGAALDDTMLYVNVQDKELAKRDLGDNVIEINESYIVNKSADGNLTTLTVEADRAGVSLEMGDILYTGKEAYQVAGVADTSIAGRKKVAYVLPDYDKVYNTLAANSKANLEDGDVDFGGIEKAVDTVSGIVACAGFEVGPVGVNAELNGDTVTATITIKATDILGDKDDINNLNLIFTFIIESKVDLKTDINIGAIVGKDSKIDLTANFYNTLTFKVAIEDSAQIAESSELDAIISKIKAMVQNANEDVVSIPVFNWTVPIGSGIAVVNFQVNAALDLAFSGEFEIEATATSGFKAEIKYNPATDEKTAKITETQGLAFEEVKVSFDGNATVYLGINATIKFELLAGVISVGIGAEVGNYNKIYGAIGTTNLLEDDISAVYGYYFEGGIYYDVKFLYSVAKITSGEKSFFGGRQEKKLYDAGDPIVITEATVDGLVYIDDTAKDLDITISTKNLVTGEEITGIKLENFAKIEDITDDNIIVENGTIKVVGDLTAETTKIKVDSIEITISVSAIKVIATDTDVGTLDAGEYRLPDGTIVIVK